MEFGANSKLLAHIHFACTSEDINNLAYGLMLKETRDDVIVPSMDNVIQSIDLLARDFATYSYVKPDSWANSLPHDCRQGIESFPTD